MLKVLFGYTTWLIFASRRDAPFDHAALSESPFFRTLPHECIAHIAAPVNVILRMGPRFHNKMSEESDTLIYLYDIL